MRGSTNVTFPPYTSTNTIRYSYDGMIWRRFSSDGFDVSGYVNIDSNTNIIQIKISGYDIIDETKFYDSNGTFYLRFERACPILYCLVGGGGGGAGVGMTGASYNWTGRGGGGGSGGQVLYNKKKHLIRSKEILRIKIGSGGSGAGINGTPNAGNPTILSIVNLNTEEEIVISQALGGPGASMQGRNESQIWQNGSYQYSDYSYKGSPSGGIGIIESDTDDFYSKSSPGGTGTTGTNSNSSDDLAGTTWPQNNICYGGGGGGGGGSVYAYNPNGNDTDTEYAGMAGGTGGGGGGGKQGTNKYFGIAGEDNTGGGGGGAGRPNGNGAAGGCGICLIKFG